MKKLLILSGCIAAAAVSLSAFAVPAVKAGAEESLSANCKSAYLCDYDSGTVVYAQNETERLPIASMCKIMTLLLSFEAADGGALSYDEKITVSENASSMGGSQVFLQTGLEYSAEQLMKSVAVCSANDSCVALAEKIAGSESAFVDQMNERAKQLGAENTLFANCTGLPKEPQYSCAKDVAVMLREMLTHKKYFEFSKVWLEDFAHPDGRTTSMTNTNKLIRFYEGCDGGKTGFTNQAGFCLAATAKRGDTRLISVVIGAESSAQRFADTKSMFNHVFANYESKHIFTAGQQMEQSVRVRGGKVSELAVCAQNAVNLFCKKGTTEDVSVQISLPEELKAPITAGEKVGEAIVYRGGVEVGRTSLVTVSGAEKHSWWDSFIDGARNWN